MSSVGPDTSESPSSPGDGQGPTLAPPRFSIRTLMLVVTALSALFAVMSAVGTVWSAAVLFFLSLVLAHVLGNSLGTELRDRATRQVAAEKHCEGQTFKMSWQLTAPRRLAERTRLHRITLAIAAAGAVAGGLLGGAGSAAMYPEAGPGAISLGIISAAVLGAFAGFGASSFISVARQALREALKDPTIERRAHPGPH